MKLVDFYILSLIFQPNFSTRAFSCQIKLKLLARGFNIFIVPFLTLLICIWCAKFRRNVEVLQTLVAKFDILLNKNFVPCSLFHVKYDRGQFSNACCTLFGGFYANNFYVIFRLHLQIFSTYLLRAFYQRSKFVANF